MKNILAKKAAIGVLVFASTAVGGYFVSKKLHLHVPVHAVAAKKGTAVEGSAFKGAEGELQLCYEDYLTRDPSLNDGQVTYHMMINEKGEVSMLELVKSDFKEQQFHDCLSEKIKSQRVVASADHIGVLIAHHFNFHRKDRTHIVLDE